MSWLCFRLCQRDVKPFCANSSISYTVNMSLSLCLATDQPYEKYPWQRKKCAAGCHRSRFDRSFELLPPLVRCSAASWTGPEALEMHKHTQTPFSFMLHVTRVNLMSETYWATTQIAFRNIYELSVAGSLLHSQSSVELVYLFKHKLA